MVSENQLIQVPSLVLRIEQPFSIKKSVTKGAVQRVCQSTSTWEGFDKARKINRKQRPDNQFPDHWSSRIASRALEKIIGEKYNIKSKDDNQISCTSSKELPPMLIILYQGNHTANFVMKVRNITALQTVLTTRKLKTCLPSLKSVFFVWAKTQSCIQFRIL